MTVLAFDASAAACSVCLLKDGVILASEYRNNGLTHSQTLLPMIARVLSDTGHTIKDIHRIGVAVGPGSFTGVKIAVATAKGLAQPTNIPCVAVSSLAALAFGIDTEGTVCAVEDARRGMLYNANFRNGQRLCDDRQISADELIRTTEGPLLFCGDGSDVALAAALAAGRQARSVLPDRRYLRAESVALLAAVPDADAVTPDLLLPRYLRLPQAERERLEKESAQRK